MIDQVALSIYFTQIPIALGIILGGVLLWKCKNELTAILRILSKK